MGIFNRRLADKNRREIAAKLAEFLKIKEPIPASFESIPLLNNQNSWFFAYEKTRESEDIDILWNVFEAAINYADLVDEKTRELFIQTYDKASSVRYVKWNLTMGLYWIRPRSYLPLDSRSRNYIVRKLKLTACNSLTNASDYLELIGTLEEHFQEDDYHVHSFPELSFAAYEEGRNNKQRNSKGVTGKKAGDKQSLIGSSSAQSLSIRKIAEELNQRASNHQIGKLQEIRADLKRKRKLGKDIFSAKTIIEKNNYAFHNGGRTELQFNIGLEEGNSGMNFLRHGIAFSLQLSRSLTSIELFVPKIYLFNDYIRCNPTLFQDMSMWHYVDSKYSGDREPMPIQDDLIKENVFIFLGQRTQLKNIKYENILDDFDRLLPLYICVEGGGRSDFLPRSPIKNFNFYPGHTRKPSSTTATSRSQQHHVNLRHNDLQEKLYTKLVANYGKKNVGTNHHLPYGGEVDVILKTQEGYWFYEIKTSPSPLQCIREAIGQLLEYSFRPEGQEAKRLIVVGEGKIDAEGETYIQLLRERFGLPISYEQVSL